MKLYGSLASPYVARVVLFARLKGITLEPEMPAGGIKSDAYLAKNPMGKMPVLEDDGVVIPESDVICGYLEDLHPGTGGLPGRPADRALARLVARIVDVYVWPPALVLFENMNPAQRDAAAVTRATQSLSKGLGYLEHFVKASPFAAGAALSLADCALIPAMVALRKTAIPLFGLADPTAGSGNLARWWASVAADSTANAFRQQFGVAFDAFLKMIMGK
jgi:glutathione S-transferase